MINYFSTKAPLRKRKRGSVLFLTLLFLVVINLFAVAFWKLVPVELNSAKKHQMETEAYFTSDAAIIESLAFLEDRANQGNIDTYFNNNGVEDEENNLVITQTGEFEGWDWEVKITPGPGTQGHGGSATSNPLRIYKLESVATRPGSGVDNKQQYRKVTAWVKQLSFADRNWGLYNVNPNQKLWLFMDSFKLDGNYFTNGPGVLQINESSFWDNDEPAIGGNFTFGVPTAAQISGLGVTDGVEYSNWGENFIPFHRDGPNAGQPNGDRYEKISGNGRAGVRLDPDGPQMPVSTDSVGIAAWGDDIPTSLPDANKVFGAASDVKLAIHDTDTRPGKDATNGIYIEGDVRQIDFYTIKNNFNHPNYNSQHSTTNHSVTQKYTDGRSSNGASNGDPSAVDPVDYNQVIRVYQDSDAEKYMEVEMITGSDYKIPSGWTVKDGSHSPGDILTGADNEGKGWTVVRNKSTKEVSVFRDQTNGTIFATGDVNGVRGIVKGRRSIGVTTDTGTQTAKDNTIVINGDLLYAGTPKGEHPKTDQTMLGLIGYAVRMRDTRADEKPSQSSPRIGQMWPRRSQQSTNNPLYLYTSIFAGRRNDPRLSSNGNTPSLQGGGFGSLSPDDTGLDQGHLYIVGSVSEGIRQWKGTGNNAGNSYEFHEDRNLRRYQPPAFPALAAFEILSWEENSVYRL